MFKFYAEEMLASSCNRSRGGVGDKPIACNPGVAGSILGFTSLSDDKPSPYNLTSAVDETLNTNM